MFSHQGKCGEYQQKAIAKNDANPWNYFARFQPYRPMPLSQNVPSLVGANWALQQNWQPASMRASVIRSGLPVHQQNTPARNQISSPVASSTLYENRPSCSVSSPPIRQGYINNYRSPMYQNTQEETRKPRVPSNTSNPEDYGLSAMTSPLNNSQQMVPNISTMNMTPPHGSRHFISSTLLTLIGFIRLWLPTPLIPYSMFIPFFNGVRPLSSQEMFQNFDRSNFPPGALVHLSTESNWRVTCGGIVVKMRQCDVWKRFEGLVMEMIVGAKGKLLFPRLDYSVEGLNPEKYYAVYVDFVLVDKYVWKYSLASNDWVIKHNAQTEDLDNNENRVFYHPNSPALGQVWNTEGIKFVSLKMTNNVNHAEGKVFLTSMRHYMPRLNIYEYDPAYPDTKTGLRIFVMPKTAFIAVTTYQDEKLSGVKIDLNPYSGGHKAIRRKRALDRVSLKNDDECKKIITGDAVDSSLTSQSRHTVQETNEVSRGYSTEDAAASYNRNYQQQTSTANSVISRSLNHNIVQPIEINGIHDQAAPTNIETLRQFTSRQTETLPDFNKQGQAVQSPKSVDCDYDQEKTPLTLLKTVSRDGLENMTVEQLSTVSTHNNAVKLNLLQPTEDERQTTTNSSPVADRPNVTDRCVPDILSDVNYTLMSTT